MNPVNCIITTPYKIPVNELIESINKIPILPIGSLWVLIREPRNENGSISLFTEKLIINLIDKWYLADKVNWSVGKGTSQDILIGKKKAYKYLGSNGIWIRFTRSFPRESWFYVENSSNIWVRDLVESSSWYEPFIRCSCPKGGTVAGLFCNEFVEKASKDLNLNYVDIKTTKG